MFDTAAGERVAETLRSTAASLDAGALTAPEAVRLVDLFTDIERLAVACRTLVAARVAETNQWRQDGDRSPEQWLARRVGSTVGAAREALETAARLPGLPKTEDALRAGELSSSQAAAVAEAATADPSAEGELLEAAGKGSVAELRRHAERVKAAVRSREEDEARHEAIRRSRYLRERVGPDGAWELVARGTPEDGAMFMARLRPFIDDEFERARKEGRRELPEAYAFDALLAMSQTGGSAKSPAKVMVRVDLPAVRRGTTEPGEVCEIAGYGPIPVSVAKSLMADADLALVLTCGVDVINVTHLNRRFTAHQQTAMDWMAPECEVDGCAATVRLERDHRTDWSETHHSRLDDADRLCHFHHLLKTKGTHRLAPGTGKRPMIPVEPCAPP